jgi:membrane-associated phospholipid phosphatase
MFDELFNAISKFAVDIMPFLPFVVFWCADKKWGYRFITTWGIGEVLNGIIKLTVCAYRPWIRSDLIEPAGDSKVAATGYSFPSGHTMVATVTYGTTFAWQKDRRRWLAILCGVMILLTGFSRNFLGVHTPQDVVVGFCESVLLIWAVGAVQKKIGDNEKALDILTLVGAAAVVLAVSLRRRTAA